MAISFLVSLRYERLASLSHAPFFVMPLMFSAPPFSASLWPFRSFYYSLFWSALESLSSLLFYVPPMPYCLRVSTSLLFWSTSHSLPSLLFYSPYSKLPLPFYVPPTQNDPDHYGRRKGRSLSPILYKQSSAPISSLPILDWNRSNFHCCLPCCSLVSEAPMVISNAIWYTRKRFLNK